MRGGRATAWISCCALPHLSSMALTLLNAGWGGYQKWKMKRWFFIISQSLSALQSGVPVLLKSNVSKKTDKS